MNAIIVALARLRLALWTLPVLVWVMLGPGASAADQDFFTAAARPGHYVLLRHARAPGVGDPPGFHLTDCPSQRNLSADGRRQARGIGRAFRAGGVAEAEIFSSQWCRCLETARLLELGPVGELEVLNSFFDQPERAAAQLAALGEFLRVHTWRGPTLLVTHQVVITGLTDVIPASGEALVVHRQPPGHWQVVARRIF